MPVTGVEPLPRAAVLVAEAPAGLRAGVLVAGVFLADVPVALPAAAPAVRVPAGLRADVLVADVLVADVLVADVPAGLRADVLVADVLVADIPADLRADGPAVRVRRAVAPVARVAAASGALAARLPDVLAPRAPLVLRAPPAGRLADPWPAGREGARRDAVVLLRPAPA